MQHFIWNWFNTSSALCILMAWCLSTRAAVAIVLIMHPFISIHWWVKYGPQMRWEQLTKLFINTIYWLYQRQNGQQFPGNIFKVIFFNET